MAIINNNVQNVKFLRNGLLYGTHDLAYEALTGFTLTTEQDGTAILARYGSGNDVKTLVGMVYASGDGSYKSITIFDIEGASGDVEKLRQEINAKLGDGITSANTATAQLAALSGNSATDTSATTSVEGAKRYAEDLIGELDVAAITAPAGAYIKSVSQADGKVSATTEDMPTVAAISETGKPIIAVAEEKGTISATAGTIDSQYVTTTGFTATNVQAALEEVNANIGAAISGLDYTDTAVTGSYVSKVDEVDGIVQITRVALPSVTDTAEAKKFVKSVSESAGEISIERGSITSSGKTIVLSDTADGGVNFEANVDGTTIIVDENTGVMSVASSALVQYEGDTKTIEISEVQDGVRTVSTLLTLSSVTPSSTTVKEEYALKNASGETIGSTIKIYKDSSLVSITYITDPADPHYQNLEYVYIDASGITQTEYVDMSSIVLEAEFASGTTVENHVVRGVVDPTSETFLTVGADGFKLAGVQDAIDDAVEGLDANVSGNSTHVSVGVVEEDGVITAVTVSESNIANADDLAGLSAKTVTALTSTNGSITASIDDAAGCKTYDIITDASKIKMSGFTADVSGFTGVTSDSTITEAFEGAESAFTEFERVTAESLNDLNTRVAAAKTTVSGGTTAAESPNAVVVTPSTVEADGHTNYTIQLGTLDCGTY